VLTSCGCEHRRVAEFLVRPAQPADARAIAELFAVVAEERDGIASEPPIDIEERTALFARTTFGTFVAMAGSQLIGNLHISASRHGFGDLGMLIDRSWRGRGVGSALMQAAIGWAREQQLHKLCLEVFPHNVGAIRLYHKHGFVEEGRRLRQYHRSSGEFWDTIVMGLLV
jgi:ribosomal-protein-alanine N-acetyltransferase